MNFGNASSEQVTIANTLCGVLHGFVPGKPVGVEVASRKCLAGKGTHKVMRIRFPKLGLDLRVLLFTPKGSEVELVAQVKIHIQALGATFRQQSIQVSYEELSEVLAGSGVLTIADSYLESFMRSETDEELEQLMLAEVTQTTHTIRVAA